MTFLAHFLLRTNLLSALLFRITFYRMNFILYEWWIEWRHPTLLCHSKWPHCCGRGPAPILPKVPIQCGIIWIISNGRIVYHLLTIVYLYLVRELHKQQTEFSTKFCLLFLDVKTILRNCHANFTFFGTLVFTGAEAMCEVGVHAGDGRDPFFVARRWRQLREQIREGELCILKRNIVYVRVIPRVD